MVNWNIYVVNISSVCETEALQEPNKNKSKGGCL